MNSARMPRKAAVRFLSVLAASLLLLCGCGHKNPPIPPDNVVPRPIADLRYQSDHEGVQLSWSYPLKTIKGSTLNDISSFELYRAEVAVDDYCSSCPIPFELPIELDGGPPVDGKNRRTATFSTTLLRPGYKYFFKVRSRTSWWADSADSNVINFVWYPPAAAPEGLTAKAGDRQVALSWQPVSLLANGSAIETGVKYQVLRRVGGKDFEQLGAPVPATEYVDTRLRNGSKYIYAVRSMMELKGELVGGDTSREVEATPIDLRPPEVPTGVTVVRTDVGVKVFWDRNNSTEIGGYRVYRRALNRPDFQMIGEVNPEYTLFVDTKAASGVRYAYAVTAIDRAEPPNESDKSKEATARYQ